MYQNTSKGFQYYRVKTCCSVLSPVLTVPSPKFHRKVRLVPTLTLQLTVTVWFCKTEGSWTSLLSFTALWTTSDNTCDLTDIWPQDATTTNLYLPKQKGVREQILTIATMITMELLWCLEVFSYIPGLVYLLVMVLELALADVKSPKSHRNSTGSKISTTARRGISVFVEYACFSAWILTARRWKEKSMNVSKDKIKPCRLIGKNDALFLNHYKTHLINDKDCKNGILRKKETLVLLIFHLIILSRKFFHNKIIL